MMKIKFKYFFLADENLTSYYSFIFNNGIPIQLKTVKRKNEAIIYTLDEARFFKYILKKQNILSIIKPKA